jgi:hypothetical protein
MKIKLYTNTEFFREDDLKNWEELVLLIPFFNVELYKKLTKDIQNITYESIFTKLFFNGKNVLERSKSIEESDYCLLPFRFNLSDDRLYIICENAKRYNKKVLAFLNDDDFSCFPIPENLILFRTSLLKSYKRINEHVFPVILPDLYAPDYISPEDSIGFCGRSAHGREEIINEINKLEYKKNIIIRDGYWFHWATTEKDLLKSKVEYNENLLQNKYTLCYKGNGNYSWRFYESLMFDRIPVLIDSDTELPFKNEIDWNKHIIHIQKNNIKNLDEILKNFNVDKMKNRNLWLKYFSCDGFVKNIFSLL